MSSWAACGIAKSSNMKEEIFRINIKCMLMFLPWIVRCQYVSLISNLTFGHEEDEL